MKELLNDNTYVFINIESNQELETIAKKICKIFNCNDFEFYEKYDEVPTYKSYTNGFEFTLFGIPEPDFNISENDEGYQLEIYPREGKPIDQLNNVSSIIVKELNEKYNINSWI